MQEFLPQTSSYNEKYSNSVQHHPSLHGIVVYVSLSSILDIQNMSARVYVYVEFCLLVSHKGKLSQAVSGGPSDKLHTCKQIKDNF